MLQNKLIIMTQAVNDFFLIDDMENFAIKNDDSQVFFKPDGDRSARIILFEAPLSRDTKSPNFTLDLSVFRSRYGRLEFRCFSLGGDVDLE